MKGTARYFAIFMGLSLLDPTGWSQREVEIGFDRRSPYSDDLAAHQPRCPLDPDRKLTEGLPPDPADPGPEKAGQIADYGVCEAPLPLKAPDPPVRSGIFDDPGNTGGAGGNTLGGGLAGTYGGGASGLAGSGGSSTSSGIKR
jgi:hypothetical protein